MLYGYEQSFREQLILQYRRMGWKLVHSQHYTLLKFIYNVHINVTVLIGKYFISETRPF